MNTIGFLISHKNNEKRRAVFPYDLQNVKNTSYLYFEKGYGQSVGFEDEEYIKYGANVVSREEALKCDIVTDVKLGDADYIDLIDKQKIYYKNKFYTEIKNIINDIRLFEYGNIIYGKDANKILNNGILFS